MVDAGAHKGGFTWWLRQFAGSRGRVAAFEPQADLATTLSGIAARLGWTNVSVENSALSAAPGEGSLVVPGKSSPGARLTDRDSSVAGERVVLTTLDDWFAASGWPDPAFIKADCEGHEPEILLGGSRLLQRARPHLLLELEHRHLGAERFRGVIEMLRGLGYRGWFIRTGSLCPLEFFNRELHQAETRGEWWKAPDYCNNFLFSLKSGRM